MSTFNASNIDMIIRAARGLGDLREKVAFLGGATTGLLLTDPASADVRTEMICLERFTGNNVNVLLKQGGKLILKFNMVKKGRLFKLYKKVYVTA